MKKELELKLTIYDYDYLRVATHIESMEAREIGPSDSKSFLEYFELKGVFDEIEYSAAYLYVGVPRLIESTTFFHILSISKESIDFHVYSPGHKYDYVNEKIRIYQEHLKSLDNFLTLKDGKLE